MSGFGLDQNEIPMVDQASVYCHGGVISTLGYDRVWQPRVEDG
jgi:hypothetical protein